MKITIEEKKKEAIKRMKMINLFPKVIEEFEEENVVNLSEGKGILFWLDDEQKRIVSQIEREHNILVYHAIHNYTEFGELLTLFYVSDDKNEWSLDRFDLQYGYACTYVKNLSVDWCSEFGTICFKPMNGGLVITA